jgi:hypothetical protein
MPLLTFRVRGSAAFRWAAPPSDPRAPIIKKFTLSIFDHEGHPAPRHIDVWEPALSSD